MPILNRAGLLKTTRGYQGGYMLAKSPQSYTVGDILRITEGSLAPVACLEDEENQCDKYETCMTVGVWKGLYKVINNYLDSITLQDILDKSRTQLIDEYYI